ncbi:MAG: hypothetical protein HY306_10720 [Nitrosomonadales bacterium]|nr:hypothetical protein [Nitrosomonadales bacterium]
MTHKLVIEPLDQRALSQRRRCHCEVTPSGLELLPAERKALLARWVKRGGRSKWETLLKDAGTANLQLADSLRDWLLRHGWASVEEERRHNEWWPLWLELRELPTLRAALGIADKEAEAHRWESLRTELIAYNNERLVSALESLDVMPVARALARCDLIQALQRWQEAGTRRDFALFARGGTKDITETEWRWLEETVDLAEFNIERHTPLLLLSAPLQLTLPHGQINLAACADFAALTPATVAKITEASGIPSRWHLIENRTSFERVARKRAHDCGVIWLPGFPPSWWRDAVDCLLDLAPAPAHISCDPDPAGISIALQAAELWQQRGLAWQPLGMGADDLAGLAARKPLTEQDRQRLAGLLAEPRLPSSLAELARWMQEHGEKGEQEGYL